MYDSILVPVDLSDSNKTVFDRTLRFAEAGHTEITLLHVIETVEDIPVEDDEDFYEELRQNADEKMSAWASRFADEGFDVTAEITYGRRGQEIVRIAREDDAELVVMRSHVIDPEEAESRGQVGTVSHQVALFAPCSVLVVRE